MNVKELEAVRDVLRAHGAALVCTLEPRDCAALAERLGVVIDRLRAAAEAQRKLGVAHG